MRVPSLKLLQLSGCVLVQELIDAQEATTDTNVDLVLVDAHVDLLGAELVNALGLTHEHDLEFGALWVVIYVLSKLLVDRVVLDGNVDCYAGLEVDDVGAQGVDLTFCFLQLLEQFK